MSKRDVAILKFLAIVIVGGAIFFFGHLRLEDEIEDLQRERGVLQAQAAENRRQAEILREINNLIPIVETSIEEIAKLYHRYLEQPEYIIFLRDFFRDSNIVLLSFDYLEASALEISIIDEDFMEANEDMAIMGFNAYRLVFDAEEEELLTFLRYIEDSGKGFTISEMIISDEVNEDGALLHLHVDMVLRFFYIEDMDQFTIQRDFEHILNEDLFRLETGTD